MQKIQKNKTYTNEKNTIQHTTTYWAWRDCPWWATLHTIQCKNCTVLQYTYKLAYRIMDVLKLVDEN